MESQVHISFIHYLTNATEWILEAVLLKESTQDESQVRICRFFSYYRLCRKGSKTSGLHPVRHYHSFDPGARLSFFKAISVFLSNSFYRSFHLIDVAYLIMLLCFSKPLAFREMP